MQFVHLKTLMIQLDPKVDPKWDPKGDPEGDPKEDPKGDPKGNPNKFMVENHFGMGKYYLCSTYVGMNSVIVTPHVTN